MKILLPIVGTLLALFVLFKIFVNPSQTENSQTQTPKENTQVQENKAKQIDTKLKEDANILIAQNTNVASKSENTSVNDTKDIKQVQEENTATQTNKTPKKASDSTSLSLAKAQEVKMKIKAREKDGIVKAKVSISHNMLTYAQAKNKNLEANFITHITALVNDRVVYDISTSQFLSKNPLIKFVFKGSKDEELTIIYTQLKGEKFYASKKIK